MLERTESRRYVWYAILLVCVVNAVNYMDRMALAVLSPLIKEDLQLTDGELGLLVGLAFSLFYAVCGIPIARLADRAERRKIIASAVAIWSIMTALCGAAQNFWHLLMARIGVGAGEAGSVSPSASLLCDYAPIERRPIALGFVATGSALGILSGMTLAGYLGEALGWRLAFVILGLPGLLLALLVLLTLREPLRGCQDAVVTQSAPQSFWATLAILWRCRTYRFLVLFLVANGFVQYGFNQWWPSFYARSFGLPLSSIGLALGLAVGACSGTGVLVGSFIAAPATRRDIRLPIWLSAAANAVAIPLAVTSLFVPDFRLSIALVSTTAFCWGISNGPVLAAQYSVVAPSMRATSGSIAVFLTSVIGFGLGPAVVGAVSDYLAPALGAESLRYALLTPVFGSLLVVVALLIAVRTLSADLQSAGAIHRADVSSGSVASASSRDKDLMTSAIRQET